GHVRAPIAAPVPGPLAGDQPCTAVVGDVAPQPVKGDEEASSKPYQEIDVHEAPEQPAGEPGELDGAKLYHRRAAADGGEVAGVAVAEGARRRSASEPG